MPTQRIGDLPPEEKCQRPDHNPPSMIVLPDGFYLHQCTSCGKKTQFTVRRPTC
jgi:hypothetical protein